MAIEAKVNYMQQLMKRLEDVLTVEQMGRLEREGYDLLDGFDMLEVDLTAEAPDDLLECFLSAMQVEGRSPKTIERYDYLIKKLMKFVKIPTRRISVYHLRNYIAAEKKRGIQDSTLDGYRQVFSSYFKWLKREELIERNPCENLGVIKCAKKAKATYTDIEIEKLNRCCKSIRDRAILHFLRSTGCRISEMTGLNRDQVDLQRLECVVHGKGNKERKVYLDEVAGKMLEDYLKTRKDDDPALFYGRRHERMQPGGVRDMLKELAKQAGVDHVHPHKFRRTLATGLARHGMPIQEVARVLGHENIETTMRYVILDNEDVKASYRRYA